MPATAPSRVIASTPFRILRTRSRNNGSPIAGKSAGLAAGAFAGQLFAPYWFTSRARAEEAKNNRPPIGCIGVGGQGTHIGKLAMGYGDIVAVCDVQRQHAERATSEMGGKAEIYEDYRKLLAQLGR